MSQGFPLSFLVTCRFQGGANTWCCFVFTVYMWQVYWKREWTSALCCCWLHVCLWRLQQQRWRCATWEREKLHWVFVDPGSMNEWTRTGVWTEKAAGGDCGQSNFTRALCKVSLRRKSIHWAAALKTRGRFFLVIPLLHRSSFTNRRCSVNAGRIFFFFLSRVHTATGHLEHSPTCSCASLVVRPALTLVRVHRGMLFATLFRAFAVIWTALCSPPSRSSSVSALRFRGGRPWEWEENENVLIKHFSGWSALSLPHRQTDLRGAGVGAGEDFEKDCMFRWCQTSGPWIQFCTNRHQGAGLVSDYAWVSKNSWSQLLTDHHLNIRAAAQSAAG